VRRHLGDKVFKTVIPRNVRVSEAPSHGMPVLMYDPRCAGSDAYTDLAIEMLRRNSGAARDRRGAAA
jgi:chromosome partitioning protein